MLTRRQRTLLQRKREEAAGCIPKAADLPVEWPDESAISRMAAFDQLPAAVRTALLDPDCPKAINAVRVRRWLQHDGYKEAQVLDFIYGWASPPK